MTDLLSVATDTERMLAACRRRSVSFVPVAWVIDACRVISTREHGASDSRSERGSLSVAYELTLSNSASRRQQTQRLYARVYRGGRGREKFLNRLPALPAFPPDDGLLDYWAELDMIVWTFPNDPYLPYLPVLNDAERVKSYLPYPRLGPVFTSPKDVAELSVSVARYHPEDRCTLRYRLRQTAAVDTPPLTFYGKIFKDQRGAETHRQLDALWPELRRRSSRILMPQSLGYDPRTAVVWQTELRGAPAVEFIGRTDGQALIDAAAVGLASLHRCSLVGAAAAPLTDYLGDVRNRGKKLLKRTPALSDTLKPLVQELAQTLSVLTPMSDRTVHGAFRLRQLFIHDDLIGLIDIDDLASGDPTRDLAELMLDLYFYGLADEQVTRLQDRLVATYAQQVGWAVPVDRLRWHLRAQLIRRIYRSHRRRPSGVEAQQRIRTLVALIKHRGDILGAIGG